MIRLPDWEARLGAYMEPLRALAFAWGEHDCCTFAAGAVAAMTGVETMDEFRGRYTTRRGAVTALRRYGAGTLADTMAAKFAAIPPAQAQRGDLVMIAGNLAVNMGRFAVTPGVAAPGTADERAGLIRLPRGDNWTHAWAVPFAGEQRHG
ncbi:DUF6950 family protein [Sphingomonas montana]|uniref:DUF6950 family protein n=1 Tax=Sphingomonas montana TaxID=1843236 RepID=UPI00096FCF74|nr:hypothetical protein [Sphingomonas montana]